jgi:hypothetical protein
LDGAYLAEYYPDHAKDGIFPKDPNLKQQLASGPLIVAGLRSQHGFELRFTREQCREHKEKYAALGGDGGLTEDVMRSACGLPVRDRKAFDQAADTQLCAIPPDSQEIRTEQQGGFSVVFEAVLQHCLKLGVDCYTLNMFKYLTLPKSAPNVDRNTRWESMLKEGYFATVVVTGKKGDNFVRPVVRPVKGLRDAIAVGVPDRIPALPELYDLDMLATYLNGNPSRLVNAQIVEQYMDESIKYFNKPKKGKKSNVEKAKAELLQRSFGKIQSPQCVGARLLVCVNCWSEAQLRWRLRDTDVPRRAHAACRLDCECAWKGKRQRQRQHLRCWEVQRQRLRCRQASQKAALAAKAHLDKTFFSPTGSTR